MAAKRTFFAVQQAGFAPDGSSTYVASHGLQSIGITTNFNLEQAFELGQLSIYQLIEQIPDVEVTMEKVLDGYPLLYHQATRGATDGSIVGRSNIKTIVALSVFTDTLSSATGLPIAEVSMSGMVLSNVSYTIPVQGNCTEAVTLMGNDKTWRDDATIGTGVFVGQFNNTDAPLAYNAASGWGIQRREHVVMSTTGIWSLDANGVVSGLVSVFPRDIYGIGSSGLNTYSNGIPGTPIQSVSVSADLGRETIFELGTKGPYHKFVNFPVEVRTEIEVISTKWDGISGTVAGGQNGASAGLNLNYQSIRVYLLDGTMVDTGTKNKLSTVTMSGGDAGGGNVSNRYSYVSYNDLVVRHPSDPSAL